MLNDYTPGMNRYYILITLLLSSICSFSQSIEFEDFVVINNDTIQCKILQVTPEFIAFNYLKNGNLAFQKTAIKNISDWKAKYNVPEKVTTRVRAKSNDAALKVQEENISKSPYPRFIIGVNTGFGYRLGQRPQGVGGNTLQHLKQLSRGLCYAIKLNHTGKTGNGIALEYGNMLIFANSLDYQFSTPNIIIKGKINERINIHYLGLSYEILRKRKLKNRWMQYSFGVGWSAFREELTAARILKIKGDAITFNYATDYMFFLNKKMYIGIHSLSSFGWISKFSVYDGLSRETVKPDTRESLFRLQLGVSFNYFIFKNN